MTDSEVIDAFGGNAKLAEILGRPVAAPRVSNWRRRGIPEGWRMIIAEKAGALGITLPTDFIEKQRPSPKEGAAA